MLQHPHRLAQRGLTVVELMVAVALIGIGVVGAIAAFNGIQQAVQSSKARTLATNLAQEKMQIVMQKSYYEILVTTVPAYNTDFSPSWPYDAGYFPPETITEGGMTFQRFTYIQVVQEVNGQIQVLPPDTPDTGMRQITIYVEWSSVFGNNCLSIQNVINNPNTVMANTNIWGYVKDINTGVGIPNSTVEAAENMGWRDTTDNTGKYSITMSPGTFDFVTNAPGYYQQIVTQSLAPNSATPVRQDFSLSPISTGTIQGYAWLNTHLVISQVVASTGSANDIEYVELYNPTTNAILMGTNSTNNSPNVVPILWDSGGGYFQRHLHYMNTSAPATGYYLISNTYNGNSGNCNNFTIAGVSTNPDACWLYVPYNSNGQDHAIECGAPCPGGGGPNTPNAGGVSIGNSNSYNGTIGTLTNWPASMIDSFGWNQNATGTTAPAAAVQGSAITPASGNGLAPGESFVRRTDTGTVINASFGRAYNSMSNAIDLLDITNSASMITPADSLTQTPVLTGTPAIGAAVSVTDFVSSSTRVTQAGNPPLGTFTVPGVETGTWTVFIDSGANSAEIDNVTVASNTVTWIPNSATTPPWPSANAYNADLLPGNIVGTIAGRVTDAFGNPILPAITVAAGAASIPTGPAGYYLLRMSTGTYDVTANPGNANGAYASQVMPGVSVNLGDVTADVNFTLAKGGKISGWITRDGINALPGVDVVALDSNGDERDTEASGMNGQFLLINLTTGTYTVQPVLDPKEVSNPLNSTATVTAGNTVWSGTFTVTGAMGTVTGNVTFGGQPIKTGVLVVVSTTTISLPPPSLSSNTLTGAAYYADSSREDGTFSVGVRGSTTSVYYVTGFYPTVTNGVPAISTKTVSNVTVTEDQTTSGVNFSW